MESHIQKTLGALTIKQSSNNTPVTTRQQLVGCLHHPLEHLALATTRDRIPDWDLESNAIGPFIGT